MEQHGTPSGLSKQSFQFAFGEEQYNLKYYTDYIYVPQRLFFNHSLSAVCLKCKTDMGTLSHCFWSCHKLQRYGDEIICEMERNFHNIIETTPSPWTLFFQVNSSWKKTLIFSHLQWGKIFFCNGSLTRLHLHHFLCYVIFSFYLCKSMYCQSLKTLFALLYEKQKLIEAMGKRMKH